jgi:hypothetical protein
MRTEYDETQSYLHSSVLLVEARVFSDAGLSRTYLPYLSMI